MIVEPGATAPAARLNQATLKSGFAVASVLLATIAILAGARSAHYLLFHTMAEIFAIVVSLSIFMLTWTSRGYLANGYLIVLGGAYGAIGLVDVFHTLTFRGMNLFPGVSTNYPTQFWLTARYLEAIALLWAPLAIGAKPRFFSVSAGFAGLAAIACAAVVYHRFPATFIDGAGLTPFKIYSEYLIIAMLIAGSVLLHRRKSQFEPRIYFLLLASIWLAVATEFCFTRYSGFYDFSNELGHYFRFLSVALAFIAVVHSGVRQPLDLIFREMHAHKRQLDELNRKLTESEGRMAAVFRASPVGIVISRLADGKILDVNDATLRLYGYARDEVIGRTVADLATYSKPAQREELVRRLRAEGGVDHFAIDFRTHSGELGVQETSGRVVELQGEPCLLAMITDITARKRAEAAQIELEAHMRESQKMEALGTLAGGVAHDFNNALAMILGNVELARQDVGPGHAALESLEEIDKASRRAKDLVQQILAFARKQTLERKPTALALVVVESARLLRATLPALVDLRVECEAGTPPVLADAAQITQLLLNLCSNAVQAVQGQGRRGEIELRLAAHTQAEAGNGLRPGRYARLTVKDNGPGMDEATRARIFEPFFTTRPAGTGLGLSVVHGIARDHEAGMEVESAPGKGSAFHVYFPAIEAEVLAATPPAAPAPGKGKHILYVDDEEGLILLMQRLLTRQGFRFSGYADPRAALAAVRADPGQFDLVVTDYNMPHLSGLEVALALKAVRADLPVVLASGYITEALRAQASDAGIRQLIYKPNTVDDLCEAVARYANAHNGNGEHG